MTELDDCQTQASTLFRYHNELTRKTPSFLSLLHFPFLLCRAARLVKMQETMDKVDARQESLSLQSYIENYSTSVATMVTDGLRVGQVQMTSDFDPSLQLVVAQAFPVHNRLSHAITTTSLSSILSSIENSRLKSREIIDNMNMLTNDDDKKSYLLQQFALNSLSSFRKIIAQGPFLPQSKPFFRLYKVSWLTYICLVLVPLYFIFISLFVFLFGVSIGPEKSSLWLLTCSLAIIQELIFIKPLVAWTKHILLPGIVHDDVKLIYNTLGSKAKLIMLRTHGLMNNANARIQHVSNASFNIYFHDVLRVMV